VVDGVKENWVKNQKGLEIRRLGGKPDLEKKIGCRIATRKKKEKARMHS